MLLAGDWAGRPNESDLPLYGRSDEQVIEQCLYGDQEAWGFLLEKYRRLIHSIASKYGATPDDAADIFQAVSLDLFSDLPKLREPRALRAWLIQVTSRKCLQWKQAQQRRAEDDLSQIESNLPESLIVLPTIIKDEGKERRLEEAVARLPDRFRQLIRMLFFDQPPRSYKEVAETLGVASGSISFLRARCLRRLHEILEEMDLERDGAKGQHGADQHWPF